MNGYTKSELYIKPYYNTLKEETMSDGIISNNEWSEFMLKVKEYLQTEKVKSIKSDKFINYTEYGINKKEAPISLAQLLCIILYCDTNELQAKFSATFRKKYPYESIQELKKRHAKYYHFGRGLVEAVFIFGINGQDHKDDYQKGPFYCGLSCVLNMGQFAIYLKSPTSTSVNIAVAINFAKARGIIMQIQNDTPTAAYQNMFDVSWISRYSEENERLWIGYDRDMQRLRIESIRMVKENKNYQLFFHSLFVLDTMLSGVDFMNVKISKENVDILSMLIMNKLNGEDENDNIEIDEYVIDCFDLYLLNKTNIGVRFDDIYESFYNNDKNEDHRKLLWLFYDLHPTKSKQFDKKIRKYDAKKYSHEYDENYEGIKTLNLLYLSNLFKLFKNVNYVEMDIESFPVRKPLNEFEFDLISMLDLIIESGKVNVKYHIKKSNPSWLSHAVTPSIKSLYNEKGYKIEYKVIMEEYEDDDEEDEEDEEEDGEDHIFIEKSISE